MRARHWFDREGRAEAEAVRPAGGAAAERSAVSLPRNAGEDVPWHARRVSEANQSSRRSHSLSTPPRRGSQLTARHAGGPSCFQCRKSRSHKGMCDTQRTTKAP